MLTVAAFRDVVHQACAYGARCENPDNDMVRVRQLALIHLARTFGVDEPPLPDQFAETPPDWMACDLSTSLLAAAAALQGPAPLRDGALDYLQLLGAIDPAGIPPANTALASIALHGAEAFNAPDLPASDIPAGILEGLAAPALSAVLSAIEAASGFGSRPLLLAPATSQLLDGALVAAFRTYDLPLGLRLLRTRRYLAPSQTAGVRTGLDFVLSSQGLDGGFGDYATSIASLTADGQSAVDARIRLPVTIQALLTLGEHLPDSPPLVQRLFGNGLLAARPVSS